MKSWGKDETRLQIEDRGARELKIKEEKNIELIIIQFLKIPRIETNLTGKKGG